VLSVGHPGERRQRLALGPGGDDRHLVGPVVADVPQLDQRVRRDVEVAEVTRHPHVAHHRPTHVDDLAAVRDSGVEHLLDPVHVGRETGHDQPLPAGGEDPVERGGDVPFGGGEAGHLGVGRVDHEQVDALLAEPGEPPQVGDPPVQRKLVHLEVAGVQHQTRPGPDRHGQGVRDGVVDRQELEVEVAEGDPFGVLDATGDGALDAVLADLLLQQRQGELGADQRDVRTLPQQVRDGADVVLVAVRQHQGLDVVQPVGDDVEARQDEVDPRVVVLGEEHPAVDDQQLPVVLQHRHVATDVAESAERDDAERSAGERGRVS
jgi:hypothetical protein